MDLPTAPDGRTALAAAQRKQPTRLPYPRLIRPPADWFKSLPPLFPIRTIHIQALQCTTTVAAARIRFQPPVALARKNTDPKYVYSSQSSDSVFYANLSPYLGLRYSYLGLKSTTHLSQPPRFSNSDFFHT